MALVPPIRLWSIPDDEGARPPGAPERRERRGGRLYTRWAAGFLALFLGETAAPAAEGVSPADPKLQELLSRMERVATLFLNEALHITCVETIKRSGLFAPERETFNYVYERAGAGGLADYRTAPGSPFKKQTPKGFHLYSAYLWVFMFHPARPPAPRHFDHRILGQGPVDLHPSDRSTERIQAIEVLFDPVPPFVRDLNDWCGTAWVDPRDAQVLKVEAVRPEDCENYKALRADLTDTSRSVGSGYTLRTFTTEFSLVKNGMRFPRTVVIRDARYTSQESNGKRRGARKDLGTVEQTYGSCAFPGVKTEEEIRGFLTGSAPPR